MRVYRYRCDWCGRFYSSQLPDGSACDNHITEHNERLRAGIARHNARLERERAKAEQAEALRLYR